MKYIYLFAAVAVGLVSTPLAAEAPVILTLTEKDDARSVLIPDTSESVTIVVDMQDLRYCGNGRIVDQARKKMARKAQILTRRLESQGREVQVLTLTRDQRLNATSPAVFQRC